MIAVVSAGPSPFWYLTRATGTVTLILLTLSVALGVANVRRVHTTAMPRFVVDAIHRNASLLAVAFLAVHIATSLFDGFAPIALLDVIIPFRAAYRPLWLGFGAVAFDLLIAVAITSLLRRRLGFRAWRATHWVSYACWPFALLHGLGTGSDAKTIWMLAITGGCVIVVLVAVVARALAGWPDHAGARLTALAASGLVPIGLLAWLPSGPLAAGWAQRAGTPAPLLGTASTITSSATGSSGEGGAGAIRTSFTAQMSGFAHQAQLDGLYEVHFSFTVAGQALRTFGVRIFGHRLAGGGVAMATSRVELGTGLDRNLYRGHVTSLTATNIAATARDPAGTSLTIQARVQIDLKQQTAGGTLTVRPTGGV